MVEVSDQFVNVANNPARIGTLSTSSPDGTPNVAYFGSARFLDDGTFAVALGPNRTLKNLEANPKAVFFCVEEGPVSFQTPGCRIYLKVKTIDKDGPLLETFKKVISEKVGPDAAKMLVAAVAFEVTETRPIVDMG